MCKEKKEEKKLLQKVKERPINRCFMQIEQYANELICIFIQFSKRGCQVHLCEVLTELFINTQSSILIFYEKLLNLCN